MSTERFPFPVRDPERIMRRRKRQALRRQVSAPNSPESDSPTDGIESQSSDDESSTNTPGQAQTQPPQAPASSIASSRVIPTLTAILPPAQATLLSSSSSTRVIPTLTAIPPPAQATLLTSASASTPPVDTSIKGNRNQPPPTSSLPLSSSSIATSNTAISASTPNIQPNAGITSTFMVSTTATTFIASSISASATTKAPTPANALGETNDAAAAGKISRDKFLSKGVETVIIVVTVGAVLAVLVYLAVRFYRKARQEKNENTTNGSRSIWGGSDQSSSPPGGGPQMAAIPSSGPLPTYIPPPVMQQAPRPKDNPFADPDPDPRRRSALTNNAVDRQERLGLVRADLLAPRELTGNLMRSATQRQANMPEPNQGHIRNVSGNNLTGSNATASSGGFPSNSDNTAWPTARVEGNTMQPNQRFDVEAGGQWDAPAPVARYSMADTEKSMPHYRTPSQWVSDQAKRNQGMTRLPG